MFKTIERVPKGKSVRMKGVPYVRFTPKMLYINEEAGRMLGASHIKMSIDDKFGILKLSPCAPEEENAFILSRVKESTHARRIETNNALLSLQEKGFPRGMIGRRLSCEKGLDGSLMVNLLYAPTPLGERASQAERSVPCG